MGDTSPARAWPLKKDKEPMYTKLSKLSPFARWIVTAAVTLLEILAPFFPGNDDHAGTGGAAGGNGALMAGAAAGAEALGIVAGGGGAAVAGGEEQEDQRAPHGASESQGVVASGVPTSGTA